MAWLVSIILLGVAIALLIRLLHLQRLFVDMDASLRSKRRLLVEDSESVLKWRGSLALVQAMNELIDSHKAYESRASDFNSQFDAILGALQEAVIVFDDERIVQYSNKAADVLFNNGREIKGLRVERALRSLSLLELLDTYLDESQDEPSQIHIESENEVLWFEASCSNVRGPENSESGGTLLVLHDITELKRLEEMRREFVANVSHELRTPLTIIKGFAETLIDDEETIKPESRKRFMNKILSNSERLHVLVEDLLTLSRTESKPEQLDLTVQPLQRYFEEIADNYRPRLSESQRIDVVVEPEVGAFAFDSYRVNQVLDNLIENTFRYAPSFTCVTLSARLEATEGTVYCSVSDDGPGVQEKDLPHLFERFYRVDKGRSRETGGTGLGLSIVKYIVQQHNGRIHAESRVGQGMRVNFTLPYRQL